MAHSGSADPFPSASNLPSRFVAPESSSQPEEEKSRARGGSTASAISTRVRRFSKGFEESNPPEGFLAATADIASSLITGPNGSNAAANKSGSHLETQSRTGNETSAGLDGSTEAQQQAQNTRSPLNIGYSPVSNQEAAAISSSGDTTLHASRDIPDSRDAEPYRPFDNGYHFPPKYSKKDSWRHGLVAFGKYTITPVGFLVVFYGLNIVAWGGMLFLLLCNASPAMCYPSCEDIDSPRRKWIEWNSQTLNALFCVTGFGLAPWRFRDMFYLLKFRLFKKYSGLRRLAGIHRGWFRLPGSQDLPINIGPEHIPDGVSRDVIPYPEKKISNAPLTGIRAPPTKLWKLDFILWMNVGNTFLQCVLSGFMWGMDRYTRPSWSTGLFVALACIVGAIGGLGMFFEGKTVKGIEGVPLTDEDREKLLHDREQGIYHYNNLKAKKPKEKSKDPEANKGGKKSEQ